MLLLDEPTRGIDIGAKAEIYGLISRLAQDGAAIVMASSELPELLAMCDRILVLCDGRLTADADTGRSHPGTDHGSGDGAATRGGLTEPDHGPGTGGSRVSARHP